MSERELEARLAELADDVQEYEDLVEAIELARDLEYLEAEGLIEIEGERLYPKEDPCFIDLSPLTQ